MGQFASGLPAPLPASPDEIGADPVLLFPAPERQFPWQDANAPVPPAPPGPPSPPDLGAGDDPFPADPVVVPSAPVDAMPAPVAAEGGGDNLGSTDFDESRCVAEFGPHKICAIVPKGPDGVRMPNGCATAIFATCGIHLDGLGDRPKFADGNPKPLIPCRQQVGVVNDETGDNIEETILQLKRGWLQAADQITHVCVLNSKACPAIPLVACRGAQPENST